MLIYQFNHNSTVRPISIFTAEWLNGDSMNIPKHRETFGAGVEETPAGRSPLQTMRIDRPTTYQQSVTDLILALMRTKDPKAVDGDLISDTQISGFVTRIGHVRESVRKLDEEDKVIVMEALRISIVPSPESQSTLHTLLNMFDERDAAPLEIVAISKRIVQGHKRKPSEAVIVEIIADALRT